MRHRADRSSIFPALTPLLVALVAICLLLAGFTSAAYGAHHPAEGVLGSAEQPAFGEPGGIAVDPATGDVLIIDLENQTVSRFKPNGEPAPFSALSGNVIDGHAGEEDKTPKEVILSNEGFGPVETEIAVAPPGAAGGTEGDIYITNAFQEEAVDIFAPSGKYIGKIEGEGYTCGVAVDEAGTVYVGDYYSGVHKLTPTAPASFGPASDFSLTHICQVAAGAKPLASGGSEGFVFATEFTNSVFKIAAQGPEEGQTQYVVRNEANTTVAVDPTTGHVFVAHGSRSSGAPELLEFDASSDTAATKVNTIAPGSEQTTGLGINTSGQIYVSREKEEHVAVYGPLPPPGPPIIENQHVVGATSTEATVEASINPKEVATTARVEYGLSAAYEHTTSAVAVGAVDEDFHPVRLTFQELNPGTLYHFRITASNALGSVSGPDQELLTPRGAGTQSTCTNSSFRTGPAARMADCRAYEMVTPIEKNNQDIATLLNTTNQEVRLDQSATSGNKLTYTTLQGFGDAQGAPYVSQYIASRTSGGWSNESITPPQGHTALPPGFRLDLEFQIFSPDLCVSALNHYADPPLAPGAFEGQGNVYKRTNCGEPGYETVSTVPEPPGFEPASPLIQGLSENDECALFVPPAGGLYENCAGQTNQINLLPDGSESFQGSVGSSGSEQASPEFTLRDGNYQNAISSDGSRVYWSSRFSQTGAPLYVRENAQQDQSALGGGNECLESEMACTIPVSEEKAFFWGASPDGARAIYTAELEGGSEIGQRLYEFDLASKDSTLLASEVLGVMGVDEEADRTYFVSLESIQGQGTAGEPNLYLFDSTKTGVARYRFIATVSQEDGLFGLAEGDRLGMVQQPPVHRVARVSPDGLHAVFASYAPLTGYDNTDAVSGKADFEVFVYDALGSEGSGSLACVSCNPSGQRPHGINVEVDANSRLGSNWAAALVPPYTTSFYGPRAMSNDGERVFFDSYDALLPSDNNGREDVYEWEAPGSGPSGAECTEASASFSPPNAGCLTLISSGESPSDSEFVDADHDGRDAFFKTASSLVPQDPGLIDIYDAREEGGFPPPAGQSPSCEGEACQGPLAPPEDQTPASASFNGPGNAKPEKCPRGKVKKNGKCVSEKSSTNKSHKKKHHKKKPQAKRKGGEGRANDNRRAGR